MNENAKYVIYEQEDIYLFTSLENYNAYIQNARLIYKFKKSEYSKQDIIDTFVSYGKLTADDIIDKTEAK